MDELDFFGLSRVIGQPGVLPQRAQKLSADLPLGPSEMLVEVDSLNIDAASFQQLKREAGGDLQRVSLAIQSIVTSRGKMHNPVTGSGGMLIGRVADIGPSHPAHGRVRLGERIASLVSLTLTPLHLRQIKAIDPKTDRVDVSGHAILFASGLFATLPTDLPETLALAALDVCGAPALTARYVREGMTVGILGAGKSGALCLAQARKSLGSTGKLIALDIAPEPLLELQALNLCDEGLAIDATQAVPVLRAIQAATSHGLCDLFINCASVPGTEMASILSVKPHGTVIFFSMATRFTEAALGAEGVGKDVTLLIGNGYVPGHAALTLELLRGDPALRALFERRYTLN